MAKIKGPLLSHSAHGSISNIITYSKKRTGQQGRKYNKPLVTPTAKQRGQRRLTEFLVAQWQNMSAGDKATWATNARAVGLNLSGYHYFLRSAQRDLYTHHGLAGYWHCNEYIGGKILDLSGNRNHGTPKPSYPSNVPTLTPSMSTRFNNALFYDGADESVDCGAGKTLDITSRITIEVWLNPTSKASGKWILQKSATGVGYLITYDWSADQKVRFRVYVGGVIKTATTNLALPLGKWTQVVGTYDNVRVRIFVNGVEQTSGTNITGSINSTTYSFKIGCSPWDWDFYHGLSDEVCVYNRALSAAEILTRYNFATAKV